MGVSKSWALRLGLCAVMAYLVVQAMSGRQGLFSLMALKDREQNLRAELSLVLAENERLEARVRQFAGPGYDRGAVMARAQEQLGFTAAERGPVLLAATSLTRPSP